MFWLFPWLYRNWIDILISILTFIMFICTLKMSGGEG